MAHRSEMKSVRTHGGLLSPRSFVRRCRQPGLPLLAIAAALVAVATPIACSDELSLENQPCPCAAGYHCCPNGAAGVCVAESVVCTPLAQLTLLAETPSYPVCMTSDADYLYSFDGDSRLRAVPKGGGGSIETRFQIPTQPNPVCSLVVDGDDVYVSLFGTGKVLRLSSPRAPEDFGGRAEMFGALLTPSAIALDDRFIYVAEAHSGAIKRITKPARVDANDAGASSDAGDAGGDAGDAGPEPHGNDEPSTDGETLGRAGMNPRNLATDADFLYWTDDGGLRKMSKRGGAITTLLLDPLLDQPVVFADRSIFWTSEGDRVNKLDLATGESFPLEDPFLVEQGPGATVSRNGTVVRNQTWSQAVDAFTTDGRQLFFVRSNAFWRLDVTLAPTVATKLFDFEEELATFPPSILMMDNTRFYWADGLRIVSMPR